MHASPLQLEFSVMPVIVGPLTREPVLLGDPSQRSREPQYTFVGPASAELRALRLEDTLGTLYHISAAA